MIRAILVAVAAIFLTACSGSGFKVDKAEYRQRVRTLGVVPVLVDGHSAIEHPRAQQVMELLRRHSAGQHQHLVELLKEQRGYFDVRPVAGDPGQLLDRVVSSRTRQAGGEGPGRRYAFDAQTVAELNRQNGTDALLVIILHGEVRTDKIWDRTRVSYLEAPFSTVLAAAAVVLPSGQVVWEQPGDADPFLLLQYPAFDEAHYNKSDEVAIRFITLAGLERHLAQPGRKWLQETVVAQPYRKLFDRLAAELKPGLLNPFKDKDSD